MSEKFLLDKRTLFRILTSYLVMTILWSLVCVFFDYYFGENRFKLKATGFVSLFCFSFVFGLQVRSWSKIFFLLTIFLVTFYLVSFVIGSIAESITNNSLWLSGLITSTTSVTVLVLALNRLKRIEFIFPCIVATVAFALPTYITPWQNFGDKIYFEFNIHPSTVMFNLWQGLTILPLSLGLSITKQQQQFCKS